MEKEMFYSEIEVLYTDGTKARYDRTSHGCSGLQLEILLQCETSITHSALYALKKEQAYQVIEKRRGIQALSFGSAKLSKGTGKEIADMHLCFGRKDNVKPQKAA
jgi:hypothetical protein